MIRSLSNDSELPKGEVDSIKRSRSDSHNDHRDNKSLRLSRSEVESIRSSQRAKSEIVSAEKHSPFYQVYQNIIGSGGLMQTCPICECEFRKRELVPFGTCFHAFCSPCLSSYISHMINDYKLVRCPFEDCQKLLEPTSEPYKELSPVEKQLYQRIIEHFEILSNPNIRRCQNPTECKGKIEIPAHSINQELSLKKLPPIQCPQCSYKHCPLCYSMSHPGVCDQEMVKFLERNKKFRQCKKCKKVIEKTEGCTHMTCICGFYFCYMCGQELKEAIHVCAKPQGINCLELLRWDIEHRQLFYECNNFSFAVCLATIDLGGSTKTPLRIIYSILYMITLYPISIVLAFAALALFFTLLIVALALLLVFSPCIDICGDAEFTLGQAIEEKCGKVVKVIFILVFYPVYIFWIVGESIKAACCENELEMQDFCQVFGEVGTGLRNVILMPFVLCVDPDRLDKKIGTAANEPLVGP